jgi:hypothetical protein
MSASDNLHKQLFHGSSFDLKPGDIIRPGKRDVFAQDNEPRGAYASTELGDAESFAMESAQDRLNQGEQLPEGTRSRVYPVEHMSEHTPGRHVSTGDDLPASYRRDLQGFRVTGPAIADNPPGAIPDRWKPKPTLAPPPGKYDPDEFG